jgi:hypothetical protein
VVALTRAQNTALLADILANIPEDHPNRPWVIATAEAVAKDARERLEKAEAKRKRRAEKRK